MSSRAQRKLQRQREQESARDLHSGEEQDAESEDLVERHTKPSAFALLGLEDGNGDGGDDDEEEEPDVQVSSSTAATGTKSKKRNKKRKKQKAGGESETRADKLDEIDLALKELSTSGRTDRAGATTAGKDSTVDEACRMLAINSRNLHARNEMRRLFGRAALDQTESGDGQDEARFAEVTAGLTARQQRRAREMGGIPPSLRGPVTKRPAGLSAMAFRRNIFIEAKQEWPVASSGGLGMEVEEKRADGTVLYRYVHSKAYQEVQAQFQIGVDSMDPHRLIALLRPAPYHCATLLQVSEIVKQQGNHADSGDLLERALFAFGRALHSTFAKSLAEGKARMDFARPENREFWLTVWRYVQNLSMRGTWRTVYEWTKLLLSLSPQEDPYALWLVLDQYALRCREDLDYINLSRNTTFRSVHHDMPNVLYSRALAECRAGNLVKGKQALFTAIGQHPYIAAKLMQGLSIDAPYGVWGKQPRTDKENLYTELYMRALDVWNTPEHIALLTEVAAALQTDTPPSPPNDDAISESEARHVLLSEKPEFIALIPREYTARMSSVSDPLPPQNNKPSYVIAQQSRRAHDDVYTVQNPQALMQMLEAQLAEQAVRLPEEDPAAYATAQDTEGEEDEANDEPNHHATVEDAEYEDD